MKSISIRQRIWLIGPLLLLVVGGTVAWMLLPPRPLSFAGGHAIALSTMKAQAQSECQRNSARRTSSRAENT